MYLIPRIDLVDFFGLRSLVLVQRSPMGFPLKMVLELPYHYYSIPKKMISLE